MLFRRFGRAQQTKKTEVDHLLSSAQKIDSLSAQILLREAYEVSYEIATSHEVNHHPWGLVLERHKENYVEYGTTYRTIYAYRLREIHKKFGLNLTEFLDLPREYVELLFTIASKEAQEGSGALADLKEELEK